MLDNDYSLVRYINRRIKNNKNFLCTITGPTGSGKSWTALSIAELIDPEFTVDRIIFKGKQLMKLINSGVLKPGSVIVWDEAGIDLSNRNWQSLTNKMLNALLQTFRHKNFILLFTVPYHDFIDASTRKLFHADFETQRINVNQGKVIIKPKLLQYNSNLGKWYRKYLKVRIDNNIIKIKRWAVPKPSMKLINDYEECKNRFTKGLNLEIYNQLDKQDCGEDSKRFSNGINMTCSRCNYVWIYKGVMSVQVHCPKCRKFFDNPKWDLSETTTQPATQLNSVLSKEKKQDKEVTLIRIPDEIILFNL